MPPQRGFSLQASQDGVFRCASCREALIVSRNDAGVQSLCLIVGVATVRAQVALNSKLCPSLAPASAPSYL